MKVAVQTITPVCVSSGEKLNTIGDYIIEEKGVALIDQKKLGNIFLEAQAPLSFARDFARLAFRREGKLVDFLREHGIDYNALVRCRWSLNASSLSGQHSRLLTVTLTSAQGAYLPGSSLKGMRRSALLFHFFQQGGMTSLRW